MESSVAKSINILVNLLKSNKLLMKNQFSFLIGDERKGITLW